MTNDKGNKLASLVVTFCSLIQILLVLLIAVKILISSFVISIGVHIFRKPICQALKLYIDRQIEKNIFSTLAREQCVPSVARPVDIYEHRTRQIRGLLLVAVCETRGP